MRPFMVGISLILYCAALVSMCESGGRNADQSKFHQVERMWQAMPIYPGLVEVNATSSSIDEKAHISKTFKFKGPYEDVRRFYLEKLTQQGWKLVKEKKMYDWSRDFGGQYLGFEKDGYELSIEYAGATSDKGWDYGIGIYWLDL